ncbi:restriction endonuclease subunit S [Bacteroidales bacterium OttesenSCG-928-B11]|nr:restriction endonuclease subunit S [Bacteroidales bacterium OttesenSCG-928-C03]MDL2311635.1 restriction endonuclease subunit S [Bacteroidales bacterium OttesenSCG-928-B11]MDL2326507.1 restriction endonuclease subunit S [Bacteroidales bacterium OttesenSCG-928-A14]
MKIDKRNWEKVKLGDVSKEISERVDNPSEYDRFVGLEHLLSGDIKVKNFTSTDKLVSSMKKFQSGDILFARRNTYLKRASLVDFDGICSGDAFVIRVDKERILGNLLAFLMNSDRLWDYANKHAAGSLNGKRVKWRDLANYEFSLPPKEEQARLAELLWAADEVVEREKKLKERMDDCFRIEKIKHFGFCVNGCYKKSFDNAVKIKDVITVNNINVGKLDTKEYQNKGKYAIVDQSNNFIAGFSDNEELVFNGNLPIIIFGDHTTIVKYIDFPFILGADGTKVIINKNNILTKYLYYAIQNLSLVPQGYRRHYSILKDCEILLRPKEEQLKIIEAIDIVENNIQKTEQEIALSQQLKSSLINQIF